MPRRGWRCFKAMSEHEKHTEFLRQCILYDESVRRQELVERISRIQRDRRCVRRAAGLMAMLTALIVAGLGYEVILVDNFPYNVPQFILNLICGLGMGSLISLLAFMGLGVLYRMKLDQHRDECRQLVAKLLESRLGKPAPTPSRDDNAGTGDGGTVRAAGEGDASPQKIESAAGR
jgi:hypothetical protein